MKDLTTFISKRLGVAEEYIRYDKTLEELGADSLDRIELMMDACDEFGIGNVSNEKLEKIKTVQDFADLIEKERRDARPEKEV